MKVSYDREEDILMLEIDDTALIDHAQHSGSLIVHFDPDDRPVLTEIQNATAFLTSSLAASMRSEPFAHRIRGGRVDEQAVRNQEAALPAPAN